MNKRKYFFLSQKKYKSYALCEREIVFQKKNFGKQPIENKPYFSQAFLYSTFPPNLSNLGEN